MTVVPELKLEMTKSSIESAKASIAPPKMPGMISGSVTRRKVANALAPEVLRRLLEVAVEADQPRAHDDHDEADAEHHVGDQQRLEAERRASEDEEEGEQRGAHHDLGRRHRDHDQEVRHAPAEELVTDQGQAIIVPMIVEINVASSASLRLVRSASLSSGRLKACAQWSKVKPTQV